MYHRFSRRSLAMPHGRKGFALIITIILMAMLVLLMVTMASLTRVETQIAANYQQVDIARRNALTALNIAIGQLQAAAGPDQRTTATAALGDAAVTSASDPSQQIGFTRTDTATTGLSTPTNGTRYWTGVWANKNNVGDPTQANNIYNANPSPVLLNWLVSGNTGSTAASLNSDGSLLAPATAAASAIPYTPIVTIGGLSDSSKATDNLYINSDPAKPAMLLVGPNTVNKDGSSSTGAAAKYIVAPLVPLKAKAASIPGLAASGPDVTIGRYAYWIGDEGVKAKYTLSDTNSSLTNTLASDAAAFRFGAAQRNGIEILPNHAAYPVNTSSLLNKVLQLSQISFADTAATPLKVRQYFHDLTTYSSGLEVDSLRGGVRQDLSNRLASGSSTPLTGAILPPTLAIVDSTLSNNTPKPSNLAGINWDILSDFYQNPVDNSTTSIQMRPASTTQGGITPVITKIRFGISVKVDAAKKLSVQIYPVISLGNPYDIDLEVPSNGLDVRFASGFTNGWGYLKLNLTSVATPARTQSLKVVENSQNPNKTSLLGGAIMRIPAGTKIPAGTVKIFSLAQDYPAYAPPQVVLLADGNGSVVNPTYALNTATTLTTDATYTQFKVGLSDSGTLAVYLLPADSSAVSLPITTNANQALAIQQLPGQGTQNWAAGYSQATLDFSTTPAPPVFSFGYVSVSLNLAPFINTNARGFGQVLANMNLRSSLMGEPLMSNSSAGGWTWDGRVYGSGPAYIKTTYPYSYTDNLYANWGDVAGRPSSLVLYSVPRRFSSSIAPILSLAQLQHANLSSDEITAFCEYPSAAGFTPASIPNSPNQPGNAIGNAFANPIINRHLTSSYWVCPNWNYYSGSKSANYYDISYLLNTKLFDSYYFSTLPQTAGGALSPLPNSRLKLTSSAPTSPSGFLSPISTATTKPDLNAGTAPAKYQTIDGAFNINSTSVEAWAAVLSGLRGLTVSTAAKQDGVNLTPYPRGLRQPGKQAPPSTVSGATGPSVSGTYVADTYCGFRALTDAQIYSPGSNPPTTATGLAVEIVKQVRSRGPFVSLSQFINRMLIAPPSTPGLVNETALTALGLKGALQAAIDNAGLNTAGFSSDNQFTNGSTSAGPPAKMWPGLKNGTTFSTTPNPSATDSVVDVNACLGSTSVGAPGWLTQADILQAIGPSLAARSDTFVIRCYGDLVSPLDSSAPPKARAWCEAVVQRVVDYIDTSVDPTTQFTNLPASSTARTFGRKFKIVSFRWLTDKDI